MYNYTVYKDRLKYSVYKNVLFYSTQILKNFTLLQKN